MNKALPSPTALVLSFLFALLAWCAGDDGTDTTRPYFVRGKIVRSNEHGVFLDCATPNSRVYDPFGTKRRMTEASIPQYIFLIGHPAQKTAVDGEWMAAVVNYAGVYRDGGATLRAYKVSRGLDAQQNDPLHPGR